MNGIDQVYSRLLEAFPVDELKSHFNVSGQKNSLINDIVVNNTKNEIQKFICLNFGFLHQHIHIYEFNGRFPNANSSVLNGILLQHSAKRHGSIWFYLHEIKVPYYSTSSNALEYLEFLIPIKIEVRGKKLILYINTLARDIKTYFSYDIYPQTISNLEMLMNNEILSNVGKILIKLDLNKGIKHLWTADFIDALNVRNRKSKSMRQERMDVNHLYKKSYPKDWSELMLTPIQKTRFAILKNNKNVKHFECNPSTGFVGFSIYPETNSAITDIIDLILTNNK